MSRSCAYSCIDPAQNERFGVHGIPERKERNDHLSKMGKYEICVPKPANFGAKGYYVDTVGKNAKAIQEYVANQLKTDKEADQLSIFDPRDPFTGSK